MAFDNFSGLAEQKTFLESFAEFSNFLFYSPLFTVIKFLAAVYVTVLVVDLILLLILSGVGESYHKNIKGMNLPLPAEAKRRWKKILKRLETDKEDYHKAAVLEADQYTERILRNAGYSGENMQDCIDQARLQAVPEIDKLQEAHDLSVKIVQDPNFSLSRRQAEEILKKYYDFLDAMEVFG